MKAFIIAIILVVIGLIIPPLEIICLPIAAFIFFILRFS